MDCGLTRIDSPAAIQSPLELDGSKPCSNINESGGEEIAESKRNHDMEWGERFPPWLGLVSGEYGHICIWVLNWLNNSLAL